MVLEIYIGGRGREKMKSKVYSLVVSVKKVGLVSGRLSLYKRRNIFFF